MIVFLKATNPRMREIKIEFHWSKEHLKRFLDSKHPTVRTLYRYKTGTLEQSSINSEWWIDTRKEYGFVDAICCANLWQFLFTSKATKGILFETPEHVTEFLLRKANA